MTVFSSIPVTITRECFWSQHPNVSSRLDNGDMGLSFGQRLKKARLAAGLTQAQLAKAAGFSHQSAIGNIEADMREGSRNIAILAQVLDVNPLWLERGEGEMTPSLSGAAKRIAVAFSRLPPEEQQRLGPIIGAALGVAVTDDEVEKRMPITSKPKTHG